MAFLWTQERLDDLFPGDWLALDRDETGWFIVSEPGLGDPPTYLDLETAAERGVFARKTADGWELCDYGGTAVEKLSALKLRVDV